MRELDALSLVRKVSVAMPSGRYRSPAAAAMAEALGAVAAELIKQTALLLPGARVARSSSRPDNEALPE